MSTLLINQDNIEVYRRAGPSLSGSFISIINQNNGQCLDMSLSDFRALLIAGYEIVVNDDIDDFLERDH